MEIGAIIGLLIITSLMIGTVLLTYSIASLINKKVVGATRLVRLIPGLVSSFVIALTIIPYGLSYPDPLGSGLTIIFSCLLIIISIVVGYILVKHNR